MEIDKVGKEAIRVYGILQAFEAIIYQFDRMSLRGNPDFDKELQQLLESAASRLTDDLEYNEVEVVYAWETADGNNELGVIGRPKPRVA